ncbi:MAG: Fpg/Nei family DNA glycosylase [Acidobacteria bacterium]|nr:Fpg/Nei family DNA glycosylase [Acidobacteriota bacterium]
MPEGHSVHRLAQQFSDVFVGSAVRASSPQGRFAQGAELLDGMVMSRARAHGKQLFLDFSDGAATCSGVATRVLRVHLGLYGALDFGGDQTFAGASSIGAPRRIGEAEGSQIVGTEYVGPPEPVGAVRVRLVTDHGWGDLRGPTACEVLTVPEAELVIGKLGPDPLINQQGDRERFVQLLTRSKKSVGQQLMEQNILAGVGNIYRAELLFRQRLNPATLGSSVPSGAAASLWEDAVGAMNDGVRRGKIVTTGDPEVPHFVYQRNSQPCMRCGELVALRELAGRKLYWCPGCQ